MKNKYLKPSIEVISVRLENSISASSSPPKEAKVEMTDMSSSMHDIWEVDQEVTTTFEW